jgi:hypothetical protein
LFNPGQPINAIRFNWTCSDTRHLIGRGIAAQLWRCINKIRMRKII